MLSAACRTVLVKPVIDIIHRRPADIERDHGVRILYACESGSRPWGFASDDSDDDVRLIYARSADAYLVLNPPRDVVETSTELEAGDEYDINGWDLFKALRLLRKTNPPLIEWLASPIVYREDEGLADALRPLAAAHGSVRALGEHYRSMLSNQHRSYLAGCDRVTTKKYLYALRPIACIDYALKHRAPPPTSLVETLDWPAGVRQRVDELVAHKWAAAELDDAPADPLLHGFIASRLACLRAGLDAVEPSPFPAAPLDAVLATVLLP